MQRQVASKSVDSLVEARATAKLEKCLSPFLISMRTAKYHLRFVSNSKGKLHKNAKNVMILETFLVAGFELIGFCLALVCGLGFGMLSL